MTQFKATHRFNGTDNLVFFSEGEEIMFVRECTEEGDGWSKSFCERNGEFVNADGTQQTVLYTGVEVI